MKISIRPGRRFFICAGTVLAFLFLCLFGVFELHIDGSNIRQGTVIAGSVLLFLTSSVINVGFKKSYAAWIAAAFLSLLSFVFGQILLDISPFDMKFKIILSNFVLILFLYVFSLTVLPQARFGLAFPALVLFAFHFVNYSVYMFRGLELTVSDFYSVKNALGIASKYSPYFTSSAFISLSVFASCFAIILSSDFPKVSKKFRVCSLASALILFTGVFASAKWGPGGIEWFGKNGTRYNGATYNVIVELRCNTVSPGENYSAERAHEIIGSYGTDIESDPDSPHIIVIMSESFSDLSVLGELTLEGDDPLEFFNSLTENTIRGSAISSIFGGGTATSEWEFLTANSEAFLPNGSIAYQQYITDHSWSIVAALKSEGYTAVAMHPYESGFWRRNTVYDIMGFDEMYFMDDLSSDDKLRDYVTDRSLYSDIIERFEAKDEGEKLFMFNVTMQNHGGYLYGELPMTVTTGNSAWPDVDRYLSLLKISDDALREFVGYFENIDEKVCLVFFGDHQPALNTDFFTSLLGSEEPDLNDMVKKYTVPFIVWTNYESEESDGVLTSLNALSSIVLDKAGISLPAYVEFVKDFSQTVPVVTPFCYFSKTYNEFLPLSQAEGDELEWIEKYKIVQYNNLFDKSERAEVFKYETY